MATYVGKVGEYDSSKETFRSYLDRMDMFFEANDLVVLGGAANAVADAAVVRKKRAIFLTELGADSFTLVNDLLAPRSAKEVELTEITRVLKEHYNPAPLEIAESFHFGTRVRKEGESIADFIVALKKFQFYVQHVFYDHGPRFSAVESNCVRERCQPGDGSRLRCDILRDRGKPAVHVGFTVIDPAVACEVADLHW